ncbi:MAG: VCBS repeat-containing protein [Turneriella sp.]|nr:VCBS repeat-containing protein [Turneriella sp.]
MQTQGDIPLSAPKSPREFLCTKFLWAFLISSSTILAEAPVLSVDVGFVPEMGGSFKARAEGTTQRNFFYVGREKRLVILDDTLKILQTIHLLNETAAIDFADLNGDQNDDLIEMTQNGIFKRSLVAGKFGEAERIIHDKLALPLYVDNLEQSRLTLDYDRDGFTDFFLPAEGKFLVYHNDGGKKFTREKILPYQPRGSFTNRLWQNSDLPSNSIRSSVIIPQPAFLDFNNDGILDAAARVDERIYYFLSQPAPQNSGKPGIIQPFAETILKIYPMPQEDIYVAYSEFVDFDGDGNLDLVYSAVKGLGLNIRVDMKVFKGVKSIPDPAKPIEHSVKGGVFSPLVASMKKRRLLLLPTVDTGLGFFINYIIRSKVSLTLQLIDPIATKDNPLEKTTLTFDSKESAVPGFTYGDFNNDGQTDFVLGTEFNGITVFGGNDDFSKKEIAKINAPAYGIFKAVTNADKSHALFIFMTQKSKADKKTAVYLAPIEIR